MRCWGRYDLFSLRAQFGQSLLGRNILVSREASSCLLGGGFFLFEASLLSSLQRQVPLEAAGCPCNT